MSWENKYTIENLCLGSGNYGQVMLAKNIRDGKNICVKQIQKHLEYEQNVMNTLQGKEFDLSKEMINFSHINLVKILDVFNNEKEKFAYIFMEKCNGNLEDYLTQFNKQKMNYEEIDELIKNIASGYFYLQQKNVVHRDLKPANILFIKEQDKLIFKIADFGLSKIIEEDDYMTNQVGTQLYRAPEVDKTNYYDDKCDIFSFGIVLLDMMTGKIGKHSCFKFKEKEKLKDQNFSQLYKLELKDIHQIYKDLLDKMIVYDSVKRISWEQLMNWKKEGTLKQQYPEVQQQFNQFSYQNPQNGFQKPFNQFQLQNPIPQQNQIQNFNNQNLQKQFINGFNSSNPNIQVQVQPQQQNNFNKGKQFQSQPGWNSNQFSTTQSCIQQQAQNPSFVNGYSKPQQQQQQQPYQQQYSFKNIQQPIFYQGQQNNQGFYK